jgi:arginase family enzyme
MKHVNDLSSKCPLTNIIWYQSIRDDFLTSFRSIIKSVGEQNCDTFLSFDIDSIISASCSGISAPATVGLSAAQACDLAFYAVKSFHVKLKILAGAY